MVLPNDVEQRRAILRRVLDGQVVTFPVQVYAFLGGRVVDFHSAAERQMCDDLRALGYRPHARLHRNSHLQFAWMHDDPDFLEPLPMPALGDEADCVGPRRTFEEITADLKRHLDAVFGKDEPC